MLGTVKGCIEDKILGLSYEDTNEVLLAIYVGCNDYSMVQKSFYCEFLRYLDFFFKYGINIIRQCSSHDFTV